jgi:hypothetical protein
MKYLLAKIIKWKRENSVKYNTHNRNSEFSSQLFDAITLTDPISIATIVGGIKNRVSQKFK